MQEVCEVDMSDFDRAFEIVVGVEGGYVDDPHDPGGRTRYGISQRAYPHEDIVNLTLTRAKELYARDYWRPAGCNLLQWPMNLALFDAAVNQGVKPAVRIAQNEFGAVQDGVMGPKTAARINAVPPREATARYLRARSDYYRSLAQWDRYGEGWVNRLFRVALAA
jgi:lysozyme family protein